MKFAISFNSISHAILLSSLLVGLLNVVFSTNFFFDKCRLTFYRIYSVHVGRRRAQQMLSLRLTLLFFLLFIVLLLIPTKNRM